MFWSIPEPSQSPAPRSTGTYLAEFLSMEAQSHSSTAKCFPTKFPEMAVVLWSTEARSQSSAAECIPTNVLHVNTLIVMAGVSMSREAPSQSRLLRSTGTPPARVAVFMSLITENMPSYQAVLLPRLAESQSSARRYTPTQLRIRMEEMAVVSSYREAPSQSRLLQSTGTPPARVVAVLLSRVEQSQSSTAKCIPTRPPQAAAAVSMSMVTMALQSRLRRPRSPEIQLPHAPTRALLQTTPAAFATTVAPAPRAATATSAPTATTAALDRGRSRGPMSMSNTAMSAPGQRT